MGFFDCEVPEVRDTRQSTMFAEWINLLNLFLSGKAHSHVPLISIVELMLLIVIGKLRPRMQGFI